MSSWTARTDTGAGGAASVTNAAVVDFVGGDGITTSNSGLSANWAVDNTVVRTTGGQSIGGAKTFTSLLTGNAGIRSNAASDIYGNLSLHDGGYVTPLWKFTATQGVSKVVHLDSGSSNGAPGIAPLLEMFNEAQDVAPSAYADMPGIRFKKERT